MKLEDVPRYYDHAAHRYDKRLRFWFDKILGIESFRAFVLNVSDRAWIIHKTMGGASCG
ncbi:hypothetical protein BMS3Bbin06_00153 [bacterium BMS3Bbin06]|nr:hypothetical protein BMS3Abin08_00245 [bacterium BMS3Abin08]GBE33643.1 hypothetical protein BMS3Bbin06_00153 [bacterium BMS3Bbin06]